MIGRLPDTLADRCIVIRMERKFATDQCDWLRNLNGREVTRKCARFVRDQAGAIASARPEIPQGLNDRARDIWEPLLALAELGGAEWAERARQAAAGLSGTMEESNSTGELLFDLSTLFTRVFSGGRVFSRDLVDGLNSRFWERAWREGLKGRKVTEQWLSSQLRPYGIRPKTMRIEEARAKGYELDDFREALQRYVPRSDVEGLRREVEEDRALLKAAAEKGDAGGGEN